MREKEYIKIDSDGKAKIHGVDHPPAVVLAKSGEYLVMKIPGHMYWAAIGSQNYASPEIIVYRIIGLKDDGYYECQPCISWRNKRKKK